MSRVTFPNFWSRVFLGPIFERHFLVADAPPPVLERFLKWYERRMRIDLSGIQVERPIFVISLPRTGSTMLQDLLCAHPQVAYINNAMNHLPDCFCAGERLRKRLRLDMKGERFVGDSVDVEAGSPSEAFQFWGRWLGWDAQSLEHVERRIEDFAPERRQQMMDTLRRVLWCSGGKSTRFFNKNPGLLPEISLLAGLFPDAKFIHLIRDPRNCANSMIKLCRKNREQIAKIRSTGGGKVRTPRPEQGAFNLARFDEREFVPYPRLPELSALVQQYGAEDVRTTAHLWNAALNFVAARKQQLGAFYEVRFEDIVAEPVEQMRRILEFCELEPISTGNAAFAEKLQQVGVIRHQNQYTGFEAVEEICRENMEQYGYKNGTC